MFELLGPGHLKPTALPVGWYATQVGDEFDVVQGGRLGLTKEKDYRSSGVSAYSAAGQDGFVDLAEYKAQPGVVLSAIGANCGRCFLADGDWTTLANVQAIVPRGRVSAQFLFYRANLPGYWERSGSAQPFIKPSSIKKAWIAFPGEPDAQKTVTRVLGLIDARIEQTEALIAKQEQVRAGLMQDLFTRGIDKSGRLRPPREEAPELYQATDWGWVPKAWDVPRVSAIADVVRGSTPRPAKDPRYFDGHFVPWITVGELSREDWPYLETTASGLTELGSSFSRYLPAGTLVISNSGYGCGVPKILSIGGCANDGVAAFFNLSSECYALFLYYWLYLNIENLRLKVARGNDQPNLNTDMIGALRVPKPAFSEQEEIAERIWSIQQTMRRERETSAKLSLARTGLMQDLLTGKVPVDALLKERAAA